MSSISDAQKPYDDAYNKFGKMLLDIENIKKNVPDVMISSRYNSIKNTIRNLQIDTYMSIISMNYPNKPIAYWHEKDINKAHGFDKVCDEHGNRIDGEDTAIDV